MCKQAVCREGQGTREKRGRGIRRMKERGEGGGGEMIDRNWEMGDKENKETRGIRNREVGKQGRRKWMWTPVRIRIRIRTRARIRERTRTPGEKARMRICDKNTKNTEDEETRIGIRRDEETKN